MSQEKDFDHLAESCSKQSNSVPICSPLSTDIWVNGSSHYFIWNYNIPFYNSMDTVNLYLYYIVNYAYVNVKDYRDLQRELGGFQVTVDDSWFISKSVQSQNLTMYAFLLPSSANVTQELSNPDSQFPRPFNFTVTQLASDLPQINSTPPVIPTDDRDKNTHTAASTAARNSLPGWAIAVIVLACVALICGAVALIWTVILSRRRNQKSNKLIPILAPDKEDGHPKTFDGVSLHSQAPILGCRSSESVAMRESSIASRPTVFNSSAIDVFRSSPMYEEEEEMRRRRLGEALLQKQLEEDGTSVKHAGRFTHVKSLADIQKSAVAEPTLAPPANQKP